MPSIIRTSLLALAVASIALTSMHAQEEENPFADPTANQVSDDPFGSSPQSTPTPSRIETVRSSTPADSMDRALQQGVLLEFNDRPFAEVQKLLNEKLGVSIYLHPSATNDSLMHDSAVNFLCTSPVTLGKALELILEEFNADFIVDGNIIKVISRDDVESPEFLVRKIYDARKLLKMIVDHRMAQYAADSEPPQQWEIFQIAQEELIDLIQTTIHYESWDSNGGSGKISGLNGLLIINSHRRSIREAELMLDELTKRMKSEE